MSGFGLWHPRRRGSIRSQHLVAGLVLTTFIAALACGSDPVPTPNAAGTPTPLSSPAPAAGGENGQRESGTPATLGQTAPPPQALASLPSISTLVEKVKPAVATISVESVSRGFFFDFNDEGAGSGIVVRPNGYIVTNYHVVRNADAIQVTLPNGKAYEARLMGRDTLTDLAIIKIDAEDLDTVTFGESDRVRVGDWVVALGNALALRGGPTVTLGIVSATGRTVEPDQGTPLYDMIQTDAAINNGNSGGPLVNQDGEVIGINTALLREAQGIGFAVSSSIASPIIDSLIDHGRVVRPLIGVGGIDVTPVTANRLNLNLTEGIIVTRLSQSGPAFQAGIRVGDVITKIDGIPTPDMGSFLTLLWTYSVGDQVEVEFISKGETAVTLVDLAERPAG